MTHATGELGSRRIANSTRKRSFGRTVALLWVAGGLSVATGEVGASVALERDRVFGEVVHTVEWSEGLWSQGNTPLPLCTTFPGGTSTGPGQPTDADSVYCGEVANGWDWTVIVPGGYTIAWGIDNLPVGIEVCAQIFYFQQRPGVLRVRVDIPTDWMVITDDHGTVIYEGSFSQFYSRTLDGLVITEARRCGLIRLVPDGACCFPDGHCELLAEAQCPTGDWREGVLCDPNPCPAPPPVGACCFLDGSCQVLSATECAAVQGMWLGAGTDCDPNPCPAVPTEPTSWGTIKAIYR